MYAITSVLNVCKTGSILEMLNVCDYLRFSIIKVQANGVSIIDFDTFAESDDLSSKLKKKREKKWKAKLFTLLGRQGGLDPCFCSLILLLHQFPSRRVEGELFG